ncbi:bifunctional diguanylate cyclase/phosphodiesterase [Rhodococcus sp. G-MC3]|uniref:putative bifunctional diguanylate cyclase/phosphodiesterase n=1 Tax=Rhodococcus sp. G-MC3 TaxID=3046209 RepID=UPI0024B90A0C|nr:bifunctional diguanylate cyclase/phosphodiesterase [Rhodococcus sp. G-MC3]MDJ0395643.1 bifunctional diguanylate cyclase/phosphodiesterase [Rhodococcus sp. G-MC3]
MTDAFTDELAALRAVVDLAPDMVALSEWTGSVRYVNPAGRALVGLPDSWKPFDSTTVDFFTSAGLGVSGDVETALARDGFWKGRSELRHFVTGEGIAVAISAFVIDNGEGVPKSVATIIRDRRKDAERNVRLQNAVESSVQYATEQSALAALGRLAITGELSELLAAAVTAATALTGVDDAMVARISDTGSSQLVLEASSREPIPESALPAGNKSLSGYTLLTGEVVVCSDTLTETRFESTIMETFDLRSGIGVPIAGLTAPWGVLSVYSHAVRGYADRDIGFLHTVADVLSAAIRRVELDRQLRQRSMSDQLTGLLNRAGAYECIDNAIERAERDGTVVAVLLLDIDDLKIINDSLGHDAGDVALTRFAERLRSAVRHSDTVARLGGDEFLVVGDVDDIDHARRLAREITAAIAGPDPEGDAPRPLSASIGITVSEPGTSRRQLIHRADLAMYRAKESGSGRNAVFDRGDIYDAERIRTLSIDLRAALDRDELTLAYQPIYDLASGSIVSMEALARWTHPVLGPIGPTEFIAVAERTGLIAELGTWALTTACIRAALWWTDYNITIRVNVSALQLHDADFPAHVDAVLAKTGLPPAVLGLEITETVWVADTARVTDTLAALHGMGVRLLLDDFGKGHSSISYLDRYPVFECFKIDRSYVSELPGARPHAIVSAITALAKAFDVNVVAEGIETVEQLDAVRAIGCELGQGYLMSRPVTADRATELLAAPSENVHFGRHSAAHASGADY